MWPSLLGYIIAESCVTVKLRFLEILHCHFKKIHRQRNNPAQRTIRHLTHRPKNKDDQRGKADRTINANRCHVIFPFWFSSVFLRFILHIYYTAHVTKSQVKIMLKCLTGPANLHTLNTPNTWLCPRFMLYLYRSKGKRNRGGNPIPNPKEQNVTKS